MTLKSKVVVPKPAVGTVLKGRVRRVEKFGVFVDLEGGKGSGLAHISEVADGFVSNLESMFKVGQGKLKTHVMLPGMFCL